MPVVKHLIVALVLSFGLSVFFWAVFGVFAAAPFVFVSLACAVVGALIGYFGGNRLALTFGATLIVRVAAYLAAGGTFALS